MVWADATEISRVLTSISAVNRWLCSIKSQTRSIFSAQMDVECLPIDSSSSVLFSLQHGYVGSVVDSDSELDSRVKIPIEVRTQTFCSLRTCYLKTLMFSLILNLSYFFLSIFFKAVFSPIMALHSYLF